jgi:sodium-dependent phosphate cotransporter
MGLVSLERIFPLTLGSNIGTTITGILAALGSSSNLRLSLQIALCHTLFNISGIIVWYPIPFLRKIPLNLATFLGEMSAEYRWFAIFYLIMTFLVIPLLVFSLSLAGL